MSFSIFAKKKKKRIWLNSVYGRSSQQLWREFPQVGKEYLPKAGTKDPTQWWNVKIFPFKIKNKILIIVFS